MNRIEKAASIGAVVVLVAVQLAAPGEVLQEEAMQLLDASLVAGELRLVFDRPVDDAEGIDLAAIHLQINGRADEVFAANITPGSRVVRVSALHGAGSLDDVTLRLDAGAVVDTRGVASGSAVRQITEVSAPFMLPSPRWFIGQFVADGAVYVVGGGRQEEPSFIGGRYLDSFVRMDLVTGETQTLGTTLPRPMWGITWGFDPRTSSDCPNGCAYGFGGGTQILGALNFTDEILRYDLASGALTPMASVIPRPHYGGPVAFTGTELVVNLWEGDASDVGPQYNFHHFDPVTDTIEPGRVPQTTIRGGSMAWDPRASAPCPSGCAYMVGGVGQNLQYTSEIVRYDNTAQALFPTNMRLSEAGLPSAVWAGDHMFAAGGDIDRKLYRTYKIDPEAGTVEQGPLLPIQTGTMALLYDGAAVYGLGGDQEPFRSQLVRFDEDRIVPMATGILAGQPGT